MKLWWTLTKNSLNYVQLIFKINVTTIFINLQNGDMNNLKKKLIAYGLSSLFSSSKNLKLKQYKKDSNLRFPISIICRSAEHSNS